MTTGASILLVEDDETLRVVLADNLEGAGYRVAAAPDVKGAERLLPAGPYDVAILDLMLPDGDGYTLCRRVRAEGSARSVLMLTARTLEDDLLKGFEAGADDYLAKPYRLRELLARVKALARRGAAPPDGAYRFGGFRLDPTARTLHDEAGRAVDLTRKEFDLLHRFVEGRGRVLTRDALLDTVWGPEVHVDARTVDNFVLSLRKKLGAGPGAGFEIATVRGVGYRMSDEA